MSGNGFALMAAVIKLISSFILQWQTSKDHENITNAEKDWKMELEKRELLQVLTPHGAKLEKRTQMKYKKERIGKQCKIIDINSERINGLKSKIISANQFLLQDLGHGQFQSY